MKQIKILAFFFLCTVKVYGQQWFPMGNIDTTGNMNGNKFVWTITNYNNKITIGGAFKYTVTTILNSVAQWNGIQWTPMSTGLWEPASLEGEGSCQALNKYHNKLYCGGGFTGAGGVIFNANHYAYNIAKWDATDWYPMTQPTDGFNSGCVAFGVYHNNLYAGHAGGNAFDSSGSIAAQGIARWNDTVFSAVGQFSGDFPIWGNFHAAAFTNYTNKLIVGGYFTSINGSAYGTYSGIATWDDTAWGTMGNGFNNAVLALTVFNGELYAGGCFSSSRDGSTALNHIAKWTGTTWVQVGEGLNDTVFALTVDSLQNKLYAGGGFTHTGLGVPAKHIAEWTGTNWQEVGGGTNRSVHALYATDSNLYVGGYFTRAGNVQASLIAVWGRNPNGVNEIGSKDAEINIYPNPSNGLFTINAQGNKITELKVTNTLGQVIKTVSSASTIDLSDVAKGIYFVEVRLDALAGSMQGRIVTKKIIKE